MFGNSKRPTCTHSWDENGQTIECVRWAVVSVNGDAYCDEHVGKYTEITQYR
jgi:hypothetical protein